MKNVKKLLVSTVMGALLILIVNVSGWASADNPVVGITMGNLQNAFLVTLKDCIQEEIEKAGGKVLVHDSRSEIGRQIEAVEEFVTKGSDIVLLQAFDRVAIIPSLIAASKANIPIIAIDSTVSNIQIAASITSDNIQAGRLCGEYLIERLRKEKGKAAGDIIIIDGKPSVTVLNRLQGFREAIKPYPDIKITATGNSGGKMNAAIEVMEKILKVHAHLDGIFAINDPSAAGALTAIESAKREKEMFIVSVDGTKTASEAIKRSSAWVFTAAQDPFAIGKTAADIAIKILKGEKLTGMTILVPVSPISIDNVDSYLQNVKF